MTAELQDTIGLDGQEPFTQIDSDILRCGRLPKAVRPTPTQVQLYGILKSYAYHGTCFPGIKRLADDLGIDERNILRHIKRLEQLDFIVVTRSQKISKGEKGRKLAVNHYIVRRSMPQRLRAMLTAPAAISPDSDGIISMDTDDSITTPELGTDGVITTNTDASVTTSTDAAITTVPTLASAEEYEIKNKKLNNITNNNPTTEDSCCCGWAEPDLPVEVHERYHQALSRLRDLYQLPPARRPTPTTASMLKEMARTCTSAQIGTIFDAADAEKDRCAGRPPNQQYLRTTMQNVLAGTSPPARQRDIPHKPGERPKSRWQADVITVQDIIAGRATKPGSKVSEENRSDEPVVSQQPANGGEAASGLRRAEGRSISYRDIVSGRASPPQH